MTMTMMMMMMMMVMMVIEGDLAAQGQAEEQEAKEQEAEEQEAKEQAQQHNEPAEENAQQQRPAGSVGNRLAVVVVGLLRTSSLDCALGEADDGRTCRGGQSS
eukprot:TRINITY_DN67511_c1_g1_i1.p5 TRINITY_DN67511_c1_g1~~TRINITY_DN67511_c1_g1_i1.p5  ORF type:complete len:103 (+),score=46.41 TRINITY_DN67511_c1_g1_i1:527-835(+)